MRLIVLSAFAAAAALAAPSSDVWTRKDGDSLDGVRWAPLTWDAQAFPNGPRLTLRGTVQEVYDQLLAVNPDWDTDFALNATSESPTNEKRDGTFAGAVVICNESKYGVPPYKTVVNAMNKFNNRAGPGPILPPGPNVCSDVYYDSEMTVVVCNNQSVEKKLESYSEVTSGLQAIRAYCLKLVMMEPYFLGGEAFNSANWSITLKRTGYVQTEGFSRPASQFGG
ncbi:hypothetical protein JDV02_000071 [Purpureocillium takamizusanense]|uniref:Uncharacterized protein n=1 Tax=Purpureocillium takamizusanense TaxID=2060973 RepID=A0A9Q8Q411_9HYPO|nr:uncharacterized protein JDV02_000071 [Purpureocillium takamizusanense]UNI13314.1 hypothetical protein JDV02_000071 [Purpureocillium takamizusanense]